MDEDIKSRLVVFVLFGASGDLAQRKIVPALFSLFLRDRLPDKFLLIGLGRSRNASDTLIQSFRLAVKARYPAIEEQRWQQFTQKFRYQAAELKAPETYSNLHSTIQNIQNEWGKISDLLFYMSLPPELFATVATGLREIGLANEPRARIIVEKPLGRDLASFRAIDTTLRKAFHEEQIFRIDHFLGKETVQNIFALRFANSMFEPIWNRRYIDHVAITVAETLGVEHRAGYYETAGALRDMVQNHLLQLMCLTAMEPPVIYDAPDVRSRKMDVMRAIRPLTAAQVAEHAVRGQYGAGKMGGKSVPGYRDEPDVAVKSNTETYAALKLFIDNWRWEGVPFYLRTGKRLSAPLSEISVRFRDVPHCAFPECLGLRSQPARLTIRLQPQEGVILKFMAKVPGSPMKLQPVDMRFTYENTFGAKPPDAYETLLWDAMRDDATLFMRADQVEIAWQLLMPIIDVWDNTPADFPNYPAGSWGPEAAEQLIQKDNRHWLPE